MLGRFPGEGNSNPLQYSCLENPMDRGVWWAIVHGVTKNQTRLSTSLFHTLFSRNQTNLAFLILCHSEYKTLIFLIVYFPDFLQ